MTHEVVDLQTAAQQALDYWERAGWAAAVDAVMVDKMDALRAALVGPVPHGCHVDLDDDMEPDGCVLDEGRPHRCIYADRLLREGKNKTACKYWKPIEVKK